MNFSTNMIFSDVPGAKYFFKNFSARYLLLLLGLKVNDTNVSMMNVDTATLNIQYLFKVV